MGRLSASHLYLRAPRDWAARAQARAEEALRLALPDEQRLVVMRRLDLGRLPVQAPPQAWSERAAGRLRQAVDRAVHGGSAGAAAADVVWFRSEAEARALLLAALAAGHAPAAWFWALAVPDWQGESFSALLRRRLRETEADPERLVELARAVVPLLDAPRLRALAADGLDLPLLRRVLAASATAAAIDAAQGKPVQWTGEPRMVVADDALYARLPLTLRAALAEAVSDASLGAPATSLLALLALLASAPECAAQPGRLPDQVARLLHAARAAAAASTPGPAPAPAMVAATVPQAARRTERESSRAAPEAAVLSAVAAVATSETASTELPRAHAAPLELASAGAGLWLLLRPLARLGLGEWLEARPSLAAEGFARQLLSHIAVRQRIAPDDPLYALLGEPAGPVPTRLLDAWRIGLDRWLRRRLRRRLADLVHRRGWLARHETGVDVRFRLAQADLALRLRAMDVDPGWVPWLGLSVRYHFRDEALR